MQIVNKPKVKNSKNTKNAKKLTNKGFISF